MQMEEEEEKSLVYQMEHKYFCQDEGQSSSDGGETFIIDIFGSSPCKAAHEKVLELLVLDQLDISHIGPVDRLRALADKVTELDLASNQLDWPAIGQLLAALRDLHTLNLSQNPALSRQLEHQGQSLPIAANLKTLILNGLSMPLPTLRAIVQSAPQLRELHLSKNKFMISTDHDGDDAEDNDDDADGCLSVISDGLEELHLNDCGLQQWSQVMAFLRLFPRLQSLFLADNPLGAVERQCSRSGAETAELTTGMRALSLSNTQIGSWASVENLETMTRLEELRLAHIPLLQEYSVEERLHLVVARLRQLRVLNGSRIDARQREESERFFIRFYADAEKKPLVYEELVAEHGRLEQLVKVDLTPKRFAQVAIHCEETDWTRMCVKLRLSGTVQELMRFAERITNIPLRLMRIFYMDKCSACGPTELRFPNQQLKMLHIEDGDEFFVQSKPARQRPQTDGQHGQQSGVKV